MDIDTQLGKYKLVEKIGAGGMAEVFKAFQSGVDRHVAVKVLHQHLAESANFQARFQREAKAIGQLQHPHIMRVIDFDSADGHSYMVMEYIEGGSLRDFLNKEKGVMEEGEALALTKQLLNALKYAHGRGMVHRDIKPANVMLPEPHHAVLTDFGLARLADDAGLTASNEMLGTAAYISPEVIKGETADARSDLYSLGAMLYEMVTGSTPHTGNTPFEVILRQVNDSFQSPRELNPALSESLSLFLQKALQKEPKERFQSAEEMLIALQQLDGNGSTVTPPNRLRSNRSTRQSRSSNRKMLPLLGAMLGVLAIAGLTAYLLTRSGGVEESTDQPIAAVVTTPETELPPTSVPTELPADTAVPTKVPTEIATPTALNTPTLSTCEYDFFFNAPDAPDIFPNDLCPLEAITTDMAEQRFVGGTLYWLEAFDQTYIHLFNGDSRKIPDDWRADMPLDSCTDLPTANPAFKPVYGFGLVWCSDPDIRAALGEPTGKASDVYSGISQSNGVVEWITVADGHILEIPSDSGEWTERTDVEALEKRNSDRNRN